MRGFIAWLWSFRRSPRWEAVPDAFGGRFWNVRWSRPNLRGEFFAYGFVPTGKQFAVRRAEIFNTQDYTPDDTIGKFPFELESQ